MELWHILLSLSSCSGRWGSSCLRHPAFPCFSLSPAGWWGCDGSGHLDPGWEEWLHQPALLQHILCYCLHPGGGWRGGHGHWHPRVLCHLQRTAEFAKSGEFCLVVLFEGNLLAVLCAALFVCPRANITKVSSSWQQCCPCSRGQVLLQSISSHPRKECAAWFKSKKCSCSTNALCKNIYLKLLKTKSCGFCLFLLPCPFYILFWKMGRGRKIWETCNKTSF